jgi:hypothetical protein
VQFSAVIILIIMIITYLISEIIKIIMIINPKTARGAPLIRVFG